MDSQKRHIAEIVKLKRLEKGYTQAQLAEKTKISLRSIQRIEKAEVFPRAYTLKLLEECLECTFEESSEASRKLNPHRTKKIILSVSSCLIIILAAFAFLFQSNQFPETPFESMIFWICVVVLLSIVQWQIWINRMVPDRKTNFPQK